MVEAVARSGYEGVTVRQVIGLAGVSRRSFYEQFSNRQDCFLRTSRMIAADELRRARQACHGDPASTERSLNRALACLVASARRQPDAFRLVLDETLTAGDCGAAVLADVLCASEQLLAPSLVSAHGASPAGAVVRALAGSLHAMLAEAAHARSVSALAAEMEAVALAVRAPDSSGAAAALENRLRDRARRAAVAASARCASAVAADEPTERMLQSAICLAAGQPVARLSAPEIADRAEVSVDAFFDAFPNRGECLEMALAQAGERLLSIASRAEEATGDWPQAVRLALAGLLRHLAANPAQARALALVSRRAGPQARARSAELDAAIGAALTRGGPTCVLPPRAATGALWHTVRQALLEERPHLLPAWSDHLAYVVLAPAIGADAAIEALGGAL
jgi:AcrR family transcriptional regulator